MAVVSNCSPLRYFIAVGRPEILHAVLGQIIIPAGVLRELTDPAAPASVRAWMKHGADWLTVLPLITPVAHDLRESLDAGESEAIQLALDTQAAFILMDERRGRREAQLRGLRTIGALGVLIEAHRRAIVSDPIQVLADLRREGFRISARLSAEFRSLIALNQSGKAKL